MSDAELIKIEKWIERDLGEETVKKLKSNPYINYGSMKQIWDFIFDNIYCPNFVKLVRINLSLDSFQENDSELAELKTKEIELDKKLNELKLESQKQDDELNSISQSIKEIDNSSIQEELDNKTFDLLLQEVYIKQAEKTVKIFDEAIKKLSIKNNNEEIINSNINFELKKQNFEKILTQYQNQMKKKLNMQIDANKNSNLKINQVNLKDAVTIINTIQKEEIIKSNEMMSESNVEREVELLKYRIENSQLIGDKFNLNYSLHDALGLQNLEFIEKNCEIINMKQEKQIINQKINEFKSKISIMFKNKSEDFKNFKIYLSTLLEYKRAEANFIELEKISNEMEAQIKNYEKNSLLNINKINELKRLLEVINKNKKIIEQLIDLNSNLINKPVELKSQIEETIDFLPEQMRLLNLSQSSVLLNVTNTSFASTSLSAQQQASLPILEDYFINDYEQFKTLLKPNQIQIFNSNDTHSKEISSIIDYLNYPDFKSKHEIFNELINMVNIIEKNYSTENIDTVQTLNDLSYLDNSLNKCKEEERQNVPKFTELIQKRIETCIKWKNTKDEKEKIVEEWWSQPACLECVFNNCTVDGKTIDYYYNIIDENIAKNANTNIK